MFSLLALFVAGCSAAHLSPLGPAPPTSEYLQVFVQSGCTNTDLNVGGLGDRVQWWKERLHDVEVWEDMYTWCVKRNTLPQNSPICCAQTSCPSLVCTLSNHRFRDPTLEPTAQPSTHQPTVQPTIKPTAEPTAKPTLQPTAKPIGAQPTTLRPTRQPTNPPPTRQPTTRPTPPPSNPPTPRPTRQPTAPPPTEANWSNYLDCFTYSGCPNAVPEHQLLAALHWWQDLKTNVQVWEDMYTYCLVTQRTDPGPDLKTSNTCCGQNLMCKPDLCRMCNFDFIGKPPTSAPTSQPTPRPTMQPTTMQPTTMQPTTPIQPTTIQPTTMQPTTMQPTFSPISQATHTSTREDYIAVFLATGCRNGIETVGSLMKRVDWWIQASTNVKVLEDMFTYCLVTQRQTCNVGTGKDTCKTCCGDNEVCNPAITTCTQQTHQFSGKKDTIGPVYPFPPGR